MRNDADVNSMLHMIRMMVGTAIIRTRIMIFR